MRLSLLFATLLLLISCGSVVPATLARLHAVDPLTADPSAIRAALILPAGLMVAPDSATMTFDVTRQSDRIRESFTLVETPAATRGIDHPAGSSIAVFGVAKADLPRILALQSRILAWKAIDPDGTKGSFAIGIGACGDGKRPSPDARGSVLLRTETEAAFMPLIREAPLRDLIGAEFFDAIKPCASPQ